MSENSAGKIFEHPWSEDVLLNLGSVTVGGTPRTSVEKYWKDEIPWMSSGDVHLRRIYDVPGRISKLGLQSSNATLVSPPSVAVGLAGQGKTRGTVALALRNICTNQSVALIKSEERKLNIVYLFYNLEFRYEELRSRSAGGGRAGLSKAILEQLPIPLPQVEYQEAIATVLSTIDRAIEQTEALIAKQQRIKTGLMQDLLTKGIDEHGNIRSEETHEFKDSAIGRIPVEWEVFLLDSLAKRGSGHTPNKNHPEYWNGGIKWVSLSDSRHLDKIFIFETEKEISDKGLKNSSAVLHPKGTVILSRDAGVGKSAILASEMAVSQHFMAWICQEDLNNLYLYYWLQKEKPRFEGIALGSTIVTIGLQFFREYLVAIPSSIDEQDMIAKILKNSDDHIIRENLTLKKLQHQKTGLMQDLLTGKVRVTPLLKTAEKNMNPH